MSFRVAIKNYQSIRDADLTFEAGLNVIVGASNMGKTAVLRSLSTSLFNLARDSHVTLGENKSAVGISYNGHKILWQRDLEKASKTVYRVDSEVFTKVGKQPLNEVGEALGIKELELDDGKERLNFQNQMSYPFLLDKNSAQLFRFLAQSAEEDSLTEVLNLMKKDLKVMQTNNATYSASMDTLKETYKKELEEVKKLKPLKPACEKITLLANDMDNFVTLVFDIEEAEKINKRISELIDKKIKADTKYSSLSVAIDIPKAKTDIESVTELEKTLKELNNLETKTLDFTERLDRLKNKQVKMPSEKSFAYIADLNESLEGITALNIKIGDKQKKITENTKKSKKQILNELDTFIKNYDDKTAEKESLESSLKKLNSVTVSITDAKNKLQKLESKLKNITDQLNEFDVCPYCGSNLK